MECRICLESDDPETMVEPCQCRGTSAYVHQRCLERYLYFYPDGICRVCMGQIVYYDMNPRPANYSILFFMLCMMLYNSQTDVSTAVGLFVASTGLLYYYYLLNALTQLNTWFFLLIMAFFAVPMRDFQMSIALLFCLVFYVSISLVPARIVGLLFTIQLLGLYSGMIMYAAFHKLNPCAYSIVVLLNAMVWVLWVRFRPQINV